MSINYVPWNQPDITADRICLRDGDAELSYGDVARRAEAVAERFVALGVRRGDSEAIRPGLLHDHCSAFHPMAVGPTFLNSLGLGCRRRPAWNAPD